MIRAAAPDAEEGVSYGAPAFRYLGRPLVAYAAAKTQFTPAAPLPDELVARIVRDRLAEIDAKARKTWSSAAGRTNDFYASMLPARRCYMGDKTPNRPPKPKKPKPPKPA